MRERWAFCTFEVRGRREHIGTFEVLERGGLGAFGGGSIGA